ncbi:MAG: TraY domain-containing protein [Saprospiraceae bacterium]
MPTLQIRDLPQDIYDKLVESAEQNRRSLTQEAVTILENVLIKEKYLIEKSKTLAELKSMAPLFKGISIDDIVAMVREDRDR